MRKRLTALSICLAVIISTFFSGIGKAEEPEQHTNLPGIGSIEIDKNGQSISKDDKVRISIKVVEGEEDAEKLDTVRVGLVCEGKEERTLLLDSKCFNVENGKYVLEFPVRQRNSEETEQREVEKWCVDYIIVKNRIGSERQLPQEYLKETTEQETKHKYWYMVTEDKAEDIANDSTETGEVQGKRNEDIVDEQIIKAERKFVSQSPKTQMHKLQIKYKSTNSAGRMKEETIIKYVDANSKLKDIMAEAEKRGKPESNYEGMTFQKWVGDASYNSGDNGNREISSWDTIYLYAQYDKVLVECKYSYMNALGMMQVKSDLQLANRNMTMSQLKKVLETYTHPNSIYPGLTFDSWYLSIPDSNEILEINAPSGFYSVYASANYNKAILSISYSMYDKHGKQKIIEKTLGVNKNITIKEARKLCYDNAPKAECQDPTRTGWQGMLLESTANDDAPFFRNDENLRGLLWWEKYEGYSGVTFTYDSIDKEGRVVEVTEGKLYPTGTSYEKIIADGMAATVKPEYETLRFKEWKCKNRDSLPETVGEGDVLTIGFEPVAENCLIQYMLYDPVSSGRESNMLSVFTVEKGTTIVPPDSIAGHENMQWDINSYKFVAQNSITTIMGKEGILDYTKENIDTLDPNTTIYLPQNTSNTLIQQIQSSSPGQTIETSFGNATILSQDILKAMKGKDTTVKLSMENSITWSIDGKSVQEEGMKDTNLLVQKYDKNKGPIPTITMNRTAGELPANQLSLVHEGAFGFNAQLSFAADESLNGKKGILLWHNNGTMQLEDSAIVKSNIAGFDFVHGSEYAVVYAMNGDVDNDSKISIRDMMRILHHISSYNTLNALQQGIADVDINNKVNIQDMMRILHVLSGHSSEL